MNAEPPGIVQHLFTVKKVGKCYAIICKRCEWRTNAMILPVTQATRAKCLIHADYHWSFDGYMDDLQKAAPASKKPKK